MDNYTARSNLNCNYNFIKNIVYYNCKILSQSLPLTWGTGPRSLGHFLLIFTSREARGKENASLVCLSTCCLGRRQGKGATVSFSSFRQLMHLISFRQLIFSQHKVRLDWGLFQLTWID